MNTPLIFLLIGIIIILVAVIIDKKQTHEKQIIYRYIPRTFEEEQKEPVYPSDIFEVMFSQPSPWIYGVSYHELPRKEHALNDFTENRI